MERGPALGGPTQVLEILNPALATELVCILRYKNHYFCASGIGTPTGSQSEWSSSEAPRP